MLQMLCPGVVQPSLRTAWGPPPCVLMEPHTLHCRRARSRVELASSFLSDLTWKSSPLSEDEMVPFFSVMEIMKLSYGTS